MHTVVATTNGIFLAYIITPANIADMDIALPLMHKLKADYDNLFKLSYYIIDSGCDKLLIYQKAVNTFGAQAIIHINWRNTKVPPEGITWEGRLVCTMNYPYVNCGNDNGTNKLLCPYVCDKVDYRMSSSWCTSTKSGYMGKKMTHDLFLIHCVEQKLGKNFMVRELLQSNSLAMKKKTMY
jgi:hypothetical protein